MSRSRIWECNRPSPISMIYRKSIIKLRGAIGKYSEAKEVYCVNIIFETD